MNNSELTITLRHYFLTQTNCVINVKRKTIDVGVIMQFLIHGTNLKYLLLQNYLKKAFNLAALKHFLDLFILYSFIFKIHKTVL